MKKSLFIRYVQQKRIQPFFHKVSSLFYQKQVFQDLDPDDIDITSNKLKIHPDYQQIQDFQDKFNLQKYENPKIILKHLNVQQNYSLKDLLYFFERLAQINQPYITETREFQQILQNIKTRFKKNEGNYHKIGSWALCLKKLRVKDSEIWEIMTNKIMEDDWYPNFKESYKAIQGFTHLNEINQKKQIDIVYEKIERVCDISIWEENMEVFKEIVSSLVLVNRRPEKLLANIEYKIQANLGMEYQVETIAEIAFSFAKLGKGSKVFYQNQQFYNSLQQVLVLGHSYSYRDFYPNKIHLPVSANTACQLIECYSFVKEKYPDFKFKTEFLQIVHKIVTNEQQNNQKNKLFYQRNNIYLPQY